MIWIFGDSFASSDQDLSWISIIGNTQNFASNGSSEYRILKNYLLQQSDIKETDSILFVHTSQSRIFLKDDRKLSSRMLSSHVNCDIILNDIFEKKEKQRDTIICLICKLSPSRLFRFIGIAIGVENTMGTHLEVLPIREITATDHL